MWSDFWAWLIMRDWRRWRRAWQKGQAELAIAYRELDEAREELAKVRGELDEAKLSASYKENNIGNLELSKKLLEDERNQLKAERDQIKDSYQRLVGIATAKKAMRRAQLEAYRMWFHGQRKDFMSLSNRFLQLANDNGMQEKYVEDLLKGVDDVSLVTEAGRENPDRAGDQDHPGRDQGGQGADRDRGAEVGVGDQAGGKA